jgi:uncharacterized glyoxalase superfamily protein PhnB
LLASPVCPNTALQRHQHHAATKEDYEGGSMLVLPIVYVSDIERSIEFYTTLAGDTPDVTVRTQTPVWAELRIGESYLALQQEDGSIVPEHGPVELAITVKGSLDRIAERLMNQGIPLEQNHSEKPFGRTIQLRDPDGLLIQIHERNDDPMN